MIWFLLYCQTLGYNESPDYRELRRMFSVGPRTIPECNGIGVPVGIVLRCMLKGFGEGLGREARRERDVFCK